MNKLTHFLRRTHNLLGLIVGAQVLLWVLSGLIFSLKPIGEVRGDHLRREAVAATLPAELDGMAAPGALLAGSGEPVSALRLKLWMGEPVWEAELASGKALFDARTGAPISPLTEENASRVAEAAWAGKGALTAITLVDPAPREAGRGEGRTMWRAEFDGQDKATFWIDPQTGELAAVRTGWWRTYDLFWGLHIMDWEGRETFSSWWLKLFAFGALVLSLAGAWLVVDRLRKGRLLR